MYGVVQVTPARGFDGVATAPRKKAKIYMHGDVLVTTVDR